MANTKVTGDLIASSTIATGNIADNAVTSDKISGITTAHITEGSNLYYTDARADARAALIVDSAPATLDTLNELAAALGDDPNFATTTANSIGTKMPLAGGTFTGNVTITGGTTNGLNITTSGTQDTININRAASNDNAITKYQTASADKWIVGLRNTGDDNFRFYSYGTSSDVLTINQANGKATFTGDVSMPTGNSTGKFAVMSTSVHGSFDFYNNGTSYFNGAVIIDSNITQTGATIASFHDQVGVGTQNPYAFDTTATKLHVKNPGSSGSVVEVARFEGSPDASGSGGTVRLGTSNDRGIYFEGGRTATVPYGKIGLTEYNGAKTPIISLFHDSATTFAGIVSASRYVATGQNLSHGASRLKISQESTTVSELRFYGPNTSTAGTLRFVGSSSNGSVGDTILTLNADGSSTFAGSTLLDGLSSGGYRIYKIRLQAPYTGGWGSITPGTVIGGLQQTNYRTDIGASNIAAAVDFELENNIYGTGQTSISFKCGGVNGVNSTEKMRISSGGNVGIGNPLAGETYPRELLDIRQSSGTDYPKILVKYDNNTGSTTAPTSSLLLSPGQFSSDDTAPRIVGYRTANFSSAAARSAGLIFGVSQNNVAKEAMRITEAQNVGIGTTSISGVKFQSVQTTSGEWTGGFKNYTSNGYGLRVDMSGSSSPQAALQVYTGSGTGFVVKNGGHVGIGTFTPTGYKLVIQNTSEDMLKLHNSTDGLDSLISFTNPGGTLGRIQGLDNGGLQFDTGNNAGGLNTNVMFMSNNGNVGIGDTAPTSISANTYNLSVNSGRNDLSGALVSKANGNIKHQQYWDGDYSFNLSASSGVFKFKGADVQVNANIKANDINGKIFSNSASWAYVTFKNDLFSFAGTEGALWEYTIKMNPNTGGSGAYRDFYYGKLGIGIGWNGSALTQYIWQQQDQTLPRSLYGSGGGNFSILFRMYYSGGVYTELAYGTAWTLRIQGLSTTTYGDIFFRRLA